MRDTVIFSGGSTDLCFAAEFMKDKMDALLIAADRGLEALLSLGLKPSAVIGDFDSASEETKKLLASDPGLSGEENRELCRKITEYTKEKEERVSL